MVIAEAAMAIPALLLVALALAWGVSLGTTSLALADAARQAARDLARGVDDASALAAAQQSVAGSRLEVTWEDGSPAVTASASVSPPGPVLSGLVITLHQRVAIPREWA